MNASSGDQTHVLPPNRPPLLDEHLGNWRALRGGERYPQLSALFDRVNPRLAPWFVIIDIDRDEVQPLRLIGTRIVDFFGGDPTGTDFLLTVVPGARPVFVECHRRMRAEPAGKFHLSVCSTTSGREVEVFALALPFLRSNGLPCAAWLLVPGTELSYGEHGAEVRAIIDQRWIDL